MTFKDWISYLIKRLNWYFETPKSERKKQKSAQNEQWSIRWFGLVPFSMKMMLRQIKGRFPTRK